MAADEMKRPRAVAVAGENEERELQIDMMELFYRLLDKAWLILLAGVAAALLAGLITHFFIQDSYTATTKLYVIGDSQAIDLTQLNFGDKLAEDYVQVFRNRDLHSQVKALLAAPARVQGINSETSMIPEAYRNWAETGYELPDYKKMERKLRVSPLNNTRILSIAYTAGSPEEARLVVAAYAEAAIAFISQKMGTETSPTVFERPYAPDIPDGPSMLRNVVIGAVVGVALAMVVLACQFILDDRVRTAEQLEKQLGLPTLGMMPIQENQKLGQKRAKEGNV